MKTVAVLVGSLGSNALNLSLAKALEQLARPVLAFDYVDIGSLPHYNDDLWDNPPESVLALKASLERADGVLLVTPEHNRSIPGVLKNAIDWGSRPWGQSSWTRKPLAIAGTSPGGTGTAVAQSHLRSILPMLDVIVFGQPEIYLQHRPGLINVHHEVTDEQTRAFLAGFMDKFAQFIEDFGGREPAAIAAE